jgi:exopolysaccharide biosynthesis WecB/TagA/CpsF family protein
MRTQLLNKQPVNWPQRKEIFGVPVTPTTYAETTKCIMDAALKGISSCVALMPVHGLMTAVDDEQFSNIIKEQFDMVCPDGQPVRWALNFFHHTSLINRVYGPELTLHVLEKAAINRVPVYFYGSKPKVLKKLKTNLLKQYRGLYIAGMESPPFRALSSSEYDQAAMRINKSGAKILFVGLGCPKQELWAAAQKGKILMPMICVGAAFDFHAKTLDQAPYGMQERGLEWLYRLYKEPKRLAKRYFYYNTRYILTFLRQFMKKVYISFLFIINKYINL